MRVLSFIPAFLLAFASFVAATPTSVAADTSCVSSLTGGNGNDAPLHPAIFIISNVTAQIQPLSLQLTSLKDGDSCTPDVVSGIVARITAIISACVTQLQSTAEVDLKGLDLTKLCGTIYGLLEVTLATLGTLFAIVLYLGKDAIGTIQIVIINLLNATAQLVGCLKVFNDASLTGILGPVMLLVCNAVDLLLSVIGGLTVVN